MQTFWMDWEDLTGMIRRPVGIDAQDQADARREFAAKYPGCRTRGMPRTRDNHDDDLGYEIRR